MHVALLEKPSMSNKTIAGRQDRRISGVYVQFSTWKDSQESADVGQNTNMTKVVAQTEMKVVRW